MDGCAVVGLPPEIDFGNADSVSRTLLEVLDQDVVGVVADMTATSYCDAAGIRAVVRASSHAEELGYWVRVVIPRLAVRRVFALTGADSLMRIYATLNRALPCRDDAREQGDQPVPVAVLVPRQPSYPDLVAPWEAPDSAARPSGESSAAAALSAPPQPIGPPEDPAALTGTPGGQLGAAHELAWKQRTVDLVAEGRSARERSRAARLQASAACARLAVTWAAVAATYGWLAQRRPDEAARLLPASQRARDHAAASRRLAMWAQRNDT
jgi:anti-anti-sigma factor